MTDKEVRFWYKDYRKCGKKKEMILPKAEFIRRFSFLFCRKGLREYGILSSFWKREKLKDLQTVKKKHIREVKPKTLLKKYRCCKDRNRVTIAGFYFRGPKSV